MSWKNIVFDDKNTNKSHFYKNKKPFIIDDIDVDNVLISKKDGKKGLFKYFIVYNTDNAIRPLCVKSIIVYFNHVLLGFCLCQSRIHKYHGYNNV